MICDKIVLNSERNVSLTAYIQSESEEFLLKKRPAMVILPGGGYAMCSEREAEPVALAYMHAGFNAFVLRYTVKSMGGWPAPLNDYDRAIEVINENADKWNTDTNHIGVIGFSAGGHLAACAATIAKHKPDAAILVYPAILKDIVDICQKGMPYPNELVDRNTAPCFIVAARDDGVVNVESSIEFMSALSKNGISFESHIYSYGEHGFSLGNCLISRNAATPRLAEWWEKSVGWLNELWGKLTEYGFGEPVIPKNYNADYDEYLSVYCSLGQILKQNEEVQSIFAPMYAGIHAIERERGSKEGVYFKALSRSTVKSLLETLGNTESKIIEINEKLKKIKNFKEQ